MLVTPQGNKTRDCVSTMPRAVTEAVLLIPTLGPGQGCWERFEKRKTQTESFDLYCCEKPVGKGGDDLQGPESIQTVICSFPSNLSLSMHSVVWMSTSTWNQSV